MARTSEHQKIHSCSVHRILSSFEQANFDERFERFGNFLDVVSHKRRKLLTGQKRARMPVQEHEQIEVAGISHNRSPSEEARNFVPVGVRWIGGRNKNAPPPRGNRGWQASLIPQLAARHLSGVEHSLDTSKFAQEAENQVKGRAAPAIVGFMLYPTAVELRLRSFFRAGVH